MQARRLSVATYILFTVVALLGTAISVFFAVAVWPWMSQLKEMNAGLCRGQLKSLALALWNYCDDYGALPPACIRSRDGLPLHSWRVLILPYCEKDDFYRRYDFSQPWNSPQNLALSESHPDVAKLFQCPSDPGRFHDWTSYVAIVGNGTLWPEGRSVSRQELLAKPKGVLLVEERESGIHWMQPLDILAGSANWDVSKDDPHGPHCAFGDGRAGSFDPSAFEAGSPPQPPSTQ